MPQVIARQHSDISALLPIAMACSHAMQLNPEGSLAEVMSAVPGISNVHVLDDNRIGCGFTDISAQAVLPSPRTVDVLATRDSGPRVLHLTPSAEPLGTVISNAMGAHPDGKGPQGPATGLKSTGGIRG